MMEQATAALAAKTPPQTAEYRHLDLLSAHVELLVASAIAPEVAAARGYRSVGRAEARALGFTGQQARPGLLIPLWRVDGAPGGYQLRPDDPRTSKDPKPIKYETPKGQLNVLDVPPMVRDALHKGGQAILITEGARKADALASLSIPTMNIAGVYGWRGSNTDGGVTALADWEMVNIRGNIFVLAFDSDILTKPDVHQALSRLKRFLEHKGAAGARVLVLPPILSGKTGIDDYIAETGATVEDLARLVVDDLPGAPTTTRAAPTPEDPAPPLSELLDQVVGTIRQYVMMTVEQADAVALWTAHTHAFGAADATAYLNINSPEKRSGKTRHLEVLETIVARPWLTGRVSSAVLVRKIDKERPTLLLDESDHAFKGDKDYAEALRGVLNSGHRRGGVASLCVGQGKEISFKDFSVYCPKAIAGIGKLPDTVADRSIDITLKRRAKNEPVRRFRQREAKVEGESIRVGLAAWAVGAGPLLRDAQPDLPEELDDRAQDGWEPLLAIADMAGGEWPSRARRAALLLSGDRDVEETSLGVQLLADLRIIFRDVDKLATTTIIEELVKMEEGPWTSLGRSHDKKITPRDLANLLKPFRVVSRSVRIGVVVAKGYVAEHFCDAWERYLSVTTLQRDDEALEGVTHGVGEHPHGLRVPADGEAVVTLLPFETGETGTSKFARNGASASAPHDGLEPSGLAGEMRQEESNSDFAHAEDPSYDPSDDSVSV